MEEFKLLKKRVLDYSCTKNLAETDKWLIICKTSTFYKGCETVIHFAISCFVKSPLEAIVESIGSVINRHGYCQRSSMTPENLFDKITVAFNGPPKFSKQISSLLEKALFDYFANKPLHFYENQTNGVFQIPSSTVSKILKKRAR